MFKSHLFAAHHLLLLSLQLLLGQLLLRRLIISHLGHGVLLLEEHHLDVAGRRHVWIDATMRSIRTTTQTGSTVHLSSCVGVRNRN